MKDRTSDPQLTYVDAKSQPGLAADKSLLFELSQDENKDRLTIDILTAEGMQDHLLGILVCPDDDGPALGYITCKKVYSPALIKDKPPSSESAGPFAYIGGLLLHPSIRGRSIAVELAKQITERTFATLQVDACIASCNPASLRAFNQAGYMPMDPEQQVFQPAAGFEAMILTRDKFQRMIGADERT